MKGSCQLRQVAEKALGRHPFARWQRTNVVSSICNWGFLQTRHSCVPNKDINLEWTAPNVLLFHTCTRTHRNRTHPCVRTQCPTGRSVGG